MAFIDSPEVQLFGVPWCLGALVATFIAKNLFLCRTYILSNKKGTQE
jgi:hypothetical protein